jgi:hypothetical protein
MPESITTPGGDAGAVTATPAVPVIHLRTVIHVHADDSECYHRRGDGPCGPRRRYGLCSCSDDVRAPLPHEAAVAAYVAAHPTPEEAEAAAAAARWLTEPGPVDGEAWTRARAGLRRLMIQSDEAADGAERCALDSLDGDERAGVRAALTDAAVSGYMAALADVRGLPGPDRARDQIVMWLLADGARPGSFLESIISAERARIGDGGARVLAVGGDPR